MKSRLQGGGVMQHLGCPEAGGDLDSDRKPRETVPLEGGGAIGLGAGQK